MPEGTFLAFDFGTKRIGVAVGQTLTKTASPLATINAIKGVPSWDIIRRLIKEWRPEALIVGLPTKIDGKPMHTTKKSKVFAKNLESETNLPVYLVDERLSTKDARSRLFNHGGFKKLKTSEVDSFAACVILEQWLQHPES